VQAGRGKEFFVFVTESRAALRPTKPSIRWVSGSFPGGKAAGVWSWPLAPI